jgi:hypothetical protein
MYLQFYIYFTVHIYVYKGCDPYFRMDVVALVLFSMPTVVIKFFFLNTKRHLKE